MCCIFNDILYLYKRFHQIIQLEQQILRVKIQALSDEHKNVLKIITKLFSLQLQ